MARLAPAQRRDAIIAATIAVALRKGLGATTARDVAAEMSTSSGLIHHYFASMDELTAAAFARYNEGDVALLDQIVGSPDDALTRLRAYLETFDPEGSRPGNQLWFEGFSESSRNALLHATAKELNREWHQRLERIVRDGIAEGVFRCDDPAGASWRILAMLDGLSLHSVAHPDELASDRIVPWAARLAEAELDLPPDALDGPLVQSGNIGTVSP